MQYLCTTAAHGEPTTHRLTYAVISRNGRHLVLEDGDRIGTVDSASEVLGLLYAGVHRQVFAHGAATGWIRLHAAAVDGPAGRVLLVGSSGSGKTTLACRLLCDGAAVGCDESIVVRDGVSLPVARRFHLKPPLETLVPEMRRFTGGLPSVSQGAVRAFDPAAAGLAWDVRAAPVEHVVLLSSTQPAGLVRGSATEVMPAVLAQTFPHGEPESTRVRQVAALFRKTPCWVLGRTPVEIAAAHVAGLAGVSARDRRAAPPNAAIAG